MTPPRSGTVVPVCLLLRRQLGRVLALATIRWRSSLMVLLTLLGMGFGSDKPAYGCTDWFLANNIQMYLGSTDPKAAWFFSNCQVTNTAGTLVAATSVAWTVSNEAPYYAKNWKCVANGLTYQYAASSCQWSLPTGPPPTSFPTCTLSASPTSIPAGGSSTLTASCSSATVLSGYTWTNSGFATSVSGGAVFPSATTTYTVVGVNGWGSSPPVTATVTVAAVQQKVFFIDSGGTTGSLLLSGAIQSAATSGGGIGAAVDASGLVWSLNTGGAGISVFSDAGVLSAPYTPATLSSGSALAIDGLNRTWIANASSVTAVSNSGTALFSNAIAGAGNISTPSALQIDPSGSVWVANKGNNTVTEIIGAAAPVATPTVSSVISATPGTRP